MISSGAEAADRNWCIRKWAGIPNAGIRCLGTEFRLKGKLCMFLICLFRRSSMKARNEKMEQTRKMRKRQSLQIPERDFTQMILRVLLAYL